LEKEVTSSEKCGLALYAGDQENLWYIESAFSKHMIGVKDKLISFNEIKKENNVTFANISHATIKGKKSVILKKKGQS